MKLSRIMAALVVTVAVIVPVRAIETDQFFAWGRELPDSSDVLSAKVNSEILYVLDEINSDPSWREESCTDVARRIERSFRLFIFHDIELWANNSSLVSRIPETAEEETRYRAEYLYSNHGPFDVGTRMPPSPTVEVGGVRIGTDKLTHFFSEGWMAYQWYRDGIGQGLTREEAELRAIRRGALLERSVLGKAVSGVISIADLEANYDGMLFYIGLCDESGAALRMGDDGWELVEPFDFRRYVSPEWDESYNPSLYTKRRWSKVLPVMRRYCDLLDDPGVVRRRAEYAERDHETRTERWIADLVEQGKLEDPTLYGIDHVCERGVRSNISTFPDAAASGNVEMLDLTPLH